MDASVEHQISRATKVASIYMKCYMEISFVAYAQKQTITRLFIRFNINYLVMQILYTCTRYVTSKLLYGLFVLSCDNASLTPVVYLPVQTSKVSMR